MIVPIDCLKPGDTFIDLDPDPRLDVNFTVESKTDDGKIIAIDEFGYKFSFPGLKLVRVRRF